MCFLVPFVVLCHATHRLYSEDFCLSDFTLESSNRDVFNEEGPSLCVCVCVLSHCETFRWQDSVVAPVIAY